MKPLAITALLALAAPMASAGDLNFKFRFESFRKAVRIAVEHRDHDRRDHREIERHRGHRDEACYCTREWVPARWVTVERKVWVPARYEEVYRPAEYAYRYDRCGNRIRVLVRPACHERVLVRGHWDVVCDRQLVRGHFHYNCNTRGHRHEACDSCGH